MFPSLLSAHALRGKKVYIEDNLNTVDLRHIMAKVGLIRVLERIRGEVFVVANPCRASSRILWVAILCGGYVATADAICGKPGVTIKYKPALAKKRQLWISQKFWRNHPTVAQIVDSLIRNWQGSMWKLLGEPDNPAVFRSTHRATKEKSSVLALVTTREFEEQSITTCVL